MKKILIVITLLCISLALSAKPKKKKTPMMMGFETIHGKYLEFTSFKGGLQIDKKMIVGGSLGMVNTFDQFLLGPFFQYSFKKKKAVRVYLESALYFMSSKISSIEGVSLTTSSKKENGILIPFLLGFAVKPFKGVPLEIAMSYGLLFDTYGDSEVSMVQNEFGNFSVVYWY